MDILQRSYQYGRSPLASTSLSMPYHVFLFGGAISHSFSPLLHSILFRSSQASWSFLLAETTSKSEFRTKLVASDTIGASITMPNKVTFGRLLDDLTEEARVIGAVNTSFTRMAPDGTLRYIGTNTDCIAIRETILQHELSGVGAVSKAPGRPALVIGGGGAARSAIYSLWTWFRPSEIYIVNRVKAEVDAMMESFRSAMPGIKLRHITSVEDAMALPAAYLIISTIPDSPPKEAGEILCWRICTAVLRRHEKGLLLDMCYMPSPNTRLLTTAREEGWETISGTEVLVRVCIAQQILWLERQPSEDGVKKALSVIGERSTPTTARL